MMSGFSNSMTKPKPSFVVYADESGDETGGEKIGDTIPIWRGNSTQSMQTS